jgi:ribose transport system permease protein
MIKLLGNLILLLILYVALALHTNWLLYGWENPHRLLLQRVGLNGILGLAAGLLIIAGGIDLSMGSLVALASAALCILLVDQHWHPVAAIAATLLLGALVGLVHGLLVTGLRVQAFIVTLCGLFAYRSFARWMTNDAPKGLGTDFVELKAFFNADLFGVPAYFLIFAGLTVLVGVFLHFSAYGRYLFAIGSNEKAAEYCGIPTKRYKVLAYVLCSTLTAGYAVLDLVRYNSVQPSETGQFLELYGIAAAVLGGCSLRGGEGNVLGIVLGTCVITILPTYAISEGVSSTLDGAILGGALLLGACIDEFVRRYYYGYKKG